MAKYLITINYGYGHEQSIHDCDSQEEADALASQIWLEAVEQQADYHAELATEEETEEFDH